MTPRLHVRSPGTRYLRLLGMGSTNELGVRDTRIGWLQGVYGSFFILLPWSWPLCNAISI
jgi:hypothetical protein